MNLQDRIIQTVREIEEQKDDLNIPRNIKMDLVQVSFEDENDGRIKTIYTKHILEGLIFRINNVDGEYVIREFETFTPVSIIQLRDTGEYRGMTLVERDNIVENTKTEYAIYHNIEYVEDDSVIIEDDYIHRGDVDFMFYYVNSQRELPEYIQRRVLDSGANFEDVGGWAEKDDSLSLYFILDIMRERGVL